MTYPQIAVETMTNQPVEPQDVNRTQGTNTAQSISLPSRVYPRHLRPHATFGDDPSGDCGCAACEPRRDCGCGSCRRVVDMDRNAFALHLENMGGPTLTPQQALLGGKVLPNYDRCDLGHALEKGTQRHVWAQDTEDHQRQHEREAEPCVCDTEFTCRAVIHRTCVADGCNWDDRGTAVSGAACEGTGDECRVLQLLGQLDGSE